MTTHTQQQDASAIADKLADWDSADREMTVRVSVIGLASLATSLAHHRARVTELQASNTATLEKVREANEKLRAHCAERYARAGDEARAAAVDQLIRDRNLAQSECEKMRKERDEARSLNGELAAGIAKLKEKHDTVCLALGESRAESQSLTVELNTARRDRDQSLKHINDLGDVLNEHRGNVPAYPVFTAARKVVDELKLARKERDMLHEQVARLSATLGVIGAQPCVPPELARLYHVAKRALARMGGEIQHEKTAEECGEFVSEFCKDALRRDSARISAGLHDVLTASLSLCEPALMAASAERLEARLVT
jgi:chromosome segregation ATPase